MLIDEKIKNLPGYYDTMYLDGYTPEQITESKAHFMGAQATPYREMTAVFLFSRNIPPPPTARKYFGTILEHSCHKELV
jgi:hypothetical protein